MVTCLGQSFPDDNARREHFRELLRQKLPELKKMEGFPIGEDEDIIALSDPPYYTACPNPWLPDFVAAWEEEKTALEIAGKRSADFHVREPYASDVSEGKNNPIYNAHSYHTKVPYPAIMRYILHYTQPGDVVLDGFAGTGMTGVAAQLCGSPDVETKLKIENEWRDMFGTAPAWGARRAILGDLSPVASFIAYNYNTPVDVEAFEREAKRILAEVEEELGWMYETTHSNGAKGKINYTVWSEVMRCPNCSHEFTFTEAFYDRRTNRVQEEVPCASCGTQLTKERADLVFETVFDPLISDTHRQPKRQPVAIHYSYRGEKYEKKPDEDDLAVLQRVGSLSLSGKIPAFKMPEMQMTKVGRVATVNVTHIHHFFLPRGLHALAKYWAKADSIINERVRKVYLFAIEQMVWGISMLNRYRPTGFSQVNQFMSGVFYFASHTSEIYPNYLLDGKIERLLKAFAAYKFVASNTVTQVADCAFVKAKDASIDYIFTDPPFGENIYYSDLNILIESWHRVLTNPRAEAIVDRAKKKTLLDYQALMESCFHNYYRVLKPGKWLTVEFSNTSAAVWNGIQVALQRAGFIVANVASLDKQQGTFQAVNSPTAVKQDLVISCYKPSEDFEAQFAGHSGEVAVWDFVAEHLAHLPVHLRKGGNTTAIIERSPKILYDRLITFYLMRGLPVPLDATPFQAGLRQRFTERDGMYFLPAQAAEYDAKKAAAPNVVQMSLLVTTESEGILWLREALKKPQTYSDLQPLWMQSITAWRKGDAQPELRTILEQNFIQEANGKWRTPNMEEAADREIFRTRALLREFATYKDELKPGAKTKKLKEVRVEALRAGFKASWDAQDFATIVHLGDAIPQNILLEDETLLLYYDMARDRV